MKLFRALALSTMLLFAPLASAIAQDTVAPPPVVDTTVSSTTEVEVTPTPGGGSTTTITTTPTIVIPWGDWVHAAITQVIIPVMGVVIMGIITWVASLLPAGIRVWINKKNTDAVEQLLERAIESGLNKVAGAAKHQQLTVDVASPVLAAAGQYAIDKAPGKLVDFMGGAAGVQEAILARLPLSAETSGAEVLATTPEPVAKS